MSPGANAEAALPVFGVLSECEKTYTDQARSSLMMALDLGKSRDSGYDDRCCKKMRRGTHVVPPPQPSQLREGRNRSELPTGCVKARGEDKQSRNMHRRSCHGPHCIGFRAAEAEEILRDAGLTHRRGHRQWLRKVRTLQFLVALQPEDGSQVMGTRRLGHCRELQSGR